MVPEKYKKYDIIDAHAHIFPEKIAENATVNIGHFYDLPMNSTGMSSKLLESGKKIGVQKYLVCSTATSPRQTSSINTFIANECALRSEGIDGKQKRAAEKVGREAGQTDLPRMLPHKCRSVRMGGEAQAKHQGVDTVIERDQRQPKPRGPPDEHP